MKNFFAMLLAFAMLFTMIGCSFSEDIHENDSETIGELESDPLGNEENVDNSSAEQPLENDSESDIETSEPEKKDIYLQSWYGSYVYNTVYDNLVTWIPKNPDADRLLVWPFTFPLYNGDEDIELLEIISGVPQIIGESEDVAELNAEILSVMDSLGREESICTYLGGKKQGVLTVFLKIRGSDDLGWHSFAYDIVSKKRINMKEYMLSRGVTEAEVIDAVNENIELLELFTPLDSNDETERMEVLLEFNGDYCVILTDRNTAIVKYAVAHISDVSETQYVEGSVTIDLGLLNSEYIAEFEEIFDFKLSASSLSGISAEKIQDSNFDCVRVTAVPYLKSNSLDAQKINTQLKMVQYTDSIKMSIEYSYIYKNDDGIVFVFCYFVNTQSDGCYAFAYDTVNDRRVNMKEYLKSRGADIESIESEMYEVEKNRRIGSSLSLAEAEVHTGSYPDGITNEVYSVDIETDFGSDWRVFFSDENTAHIYYKATFTFAFSDSVSERYNYYTVELE